MTWIIRGARAADAADAIVMQMAGAGDRGCLCLAWNRVYGVGQGIGGDCHPRHDERVAEGHLIGEVRATLGKENPHGIIGKRR